MPRERKEITGKKWKLLKIFLIVIVWYVSTVLLISLNKILMQDTSKFRLPIFLTFMHMCVAYLCCEIVLSFKRRPSEAVFTPTKVGIGIGINITTTYLSARQNLRSSKQFLNIFVLSHAFAVSIVAAVASLEYLEVSFEQAIAACTPAVTAFMRMVILQKKENLRVNVSLVPVIVGGIVTTGAEPVLHAKGFALALTSMLARATKSCMQELLMSREEVNESGGIEKDSLDETCKSAKLDSLNTLRWMSLISICILLPASIGIEGAPRIEAALRSAYEKPEVASVLCANCIGAFFVNISQFLVTQHVGALSMQILGNIKIILTVLLSVIIFKNFVGMQSLLGYGLTLMGCFIYLREKLRK